MGVVQLLIFLSGLAIGFIIAWILFIKRIADKEKTSQQVQQQSQLLLQQLLEKANQQLINTQEALQRTQEEKELLIQEKATSEARGKHLETALAEQKAELLSISEKLSTQFKNLANDVLEEKSKKFTDQNQLNLERIIKPFSEKIIAFEKKVEETTKEHLISNTHLHSEVKRLSEASALVTKEAEQLAQAIKGSNKLQGQWGELILERILEKSGLLEGREYTLQESFTDKEENKRYRPDVIIKLPENKSIIIDAKMTLVSYERYANSEEEGARALHLKHHLHAIRQHMQELSQKDYCAKYHLSSLDFVFMFIPLESAFGLALQKDDSLFYDAWDKNIILVSPSSLIAILRTVACIWRNEYQNRNVLEIAKEGGALYDKFVGFLNDFKKIGGAIEGANASYNEAVKKLHDGKGNLIRRAEHLKKLGAKASKELPTDLFATSSGYLLSIEE